VNTNTTVGAGEGVASGANMHQARSTEHLDWRHRLRRVRALVVKETRQVMRDPSSIAIGVVLPMILILRLYSAGRGTSHVRDWIVEDQDHGQHYTDGDAGGITHDLAGFFHDQRTNPAQSVAPIEVLCGTRWCMFAPLATPSPAPTVVLVFTPLPHSSRSACASARPQR